MVRKCITHHVCREYIRHRMNIMTGPNSWAPANRFLLKPCPSAATTLSPLSDDTTWHRYHHGEADVGSDIAEPYKPCERPCEPGAHLAELVTDGSRVLQRFDHHERWETQATMEDR